MESIARWRVMVPLMPPNCDLKSHLAERRSIAEVLAKRRSLIEAIGHTSRFTNVVVFPERDVTRYRTEQRLAG